MLNIEDEFDLMIRKTFNFKILVNSTQSVKKIMAKKGLTPAEFLRPFTINKHLEINYQFDKFFQSHRSKNLSFSFYDFQQYRSPQKQKYQKESLKLVNKLKPNIECMNIEKYETPSQVQKYINSQSFYWFFQSVKLFIDFTSFNFGINFLDIPFGVVQMISSNDSQINQKLNKMRKQNNDLIKIAYQHNPMDINRIPLILILIVDKSNENAQKKVELIQQYLKQMNYNIKNIIKIRVNSNDATDQIIWNTFIKTNFNIQIQRFTDLIKIINKQQKNNITNSIHPMLKQIKQLVQEKIKSLYKFYKQNVSGFFVNLRTNFFKSDKSQSNLGAKETNLRFFADLMFLLGDYQTAAKLYKITYDLLKGKITYLQANCKQMNVCCIMMLKVKYNQQTINQQLQRQFDQIFQNYKYYGSNKGIFKFCIRSLILFVFFIYLFRRFDKTDIQSLYKLKLKPHLTQYSHICLFINQQIVNFNLLQSTVKFRKFTQQMLYLAQKLQTIPLKYHALRCFIVIEKVFQNKFNDCQQYVSLYESKLCYECRYYQKSLRILRLTWNSLTSNFEKKKVDSFITNYKIIISRLSKKQELLSNEKLRQICKITIIKHPIIRRQRIQIITGEDLSDGKYFQILNQVKFEKNTIFQNLAEEYMYRKFKKKEYILINAMLMQYNSVQASQVTFRRMFYKGQKIKIRILVQNVLSISIPMYNVHPICSQQIFQTRKNQFLAKPKQFTLIQLEYQIMKSTYSVLKGFEWHMSLQNQIEYNCILFPQLEVLDQQKNFIDPNSLSYFEFSIQQKAALLDIQIENLNLFVYYGQTKNINIIIKNIGTTIAQQIVLFCSQPQIVGFSQLNIENIEKYQNKILKYQFLVNKKKSARIYFLLLYRSQGKIRYKKYIKKLIVKDSIQINLLALQRLTSKKYLLSIQIKNKLTDNITQSVNLLEMSQNDNFSLQSFLIQDKKEWKFENISLIKKQDSNIYNLMISKKQIQQQTQISIHNLTSINNYQLFHQIPHQKNQAFTLFIFWSYQYINGINSLSIQTQNKTMFALPIFTYIHYQPQFIWNEPFIQIKIQLIIQNPHQYNIPLVIQAVDGDERFQYEQDLMPGFYWQGLKKINLDLLKKEKRQFVYKLIVLQKNRLNIGRFKFTFYRKQGKYIQQPIQMNKNMQRSYYPYPGQIWIIPKQINKKQNSKQVKQQQLL